MYKKAVSSKLKGGILAEVVCGVFLGVVIVFLKDTALYLVGGFILLFMIMIAVSMVGYVTHLNALKAEYGDELEVDINTCQKNCSDKYFFFDDCMIDLANARMIFYSDIQKIEGIHRNESFSHIDMQHRRAGAVINLIMCDGKNYLFSSFGKSAVIDSDEVIDGYYAFAKYIEEYAPHALASIK